MGRSSVSCFKIITCAGDSVDRDDLEASSESKRSIDKKWSFRKKSTRNQVISNTVISEPLSSEIKESPEAATFNFQGEENSTIPEKISEMQWTDEASQLSTSANSKLSEIMAATENDTKVDAGPDESVIIVIQAGVRGFLAQRELLKHKNIIKLQAAVRGHLVRSHAVGTLRCVQAIVKMQSLVRARRARLLTEGSNIEDLQGKQNSGTEPHAKYTSIEKLLGNSFARQLLESTPKTKSINIKCDPSKSDSAWKWLERWMSASPSGGEQPHKPELTTEPQKEQNKVKHPENQVENVISTAEDHPKSTYLRPSTVEEAAGPSLKSSMEEEPVLTEIKENLVTSDLDSFEIQACQPTSSLISQNMEKSQLENTEKSNSKENPDLPHSQATQSHFIPQMELNSISDKPDLETEPPKRSVKRNAPEQPETEGRKLVFGRKASNPAFIAAQSKFEELTSTTNSARSISSSNQDYGVESCTDTLSSAADTTIRNREVQVGGSECGTELSITSTLDSPDQSEAEAVEFVQEPKVLEKGTDNPKSPKTLDIEARNEATLMGTDLSYPISMQPEKNEKSNGDDIEVSKSESVIDFPQQVNQKLEKTASDVQIEMESDTGHQACKSSSEASPRSHITVPESQTTPSSQVSSSKAKKARGDKNGSSQKRKSLSAGKKSPRNPNHDSDVRNNLEQLPKDHKTGKRRNSFGSARPDQVDQEPRDSSASNSLPSYMQATESARAKALASGSSPRSSPDVQDKEIYTKKRHSLPGANGRQGSPRIQRSLSQAQPSTKGNGTQPSHERKWQR